MFDYKNEPSYDNFRQEEESCQSYLGKQTDEMKIEIHPPQNNAMIEYLGKNKGESESAKLQRIKLKFLVY